MAQSATNPKIEELRFRLKTDPRSRLFYQLAEELRKAGQFEESEQVLRTGLEAYPAYLAAWVSLGRVQRELKDNEAAILSLEKAMQLDPGNVVAARLLGDSHRDLGDEVEAIKKYKLVQALLPGDEELKATIEQLERSLHPPEPGPLPAGAEPFPAEEEPSQPAERAPYFVEAPSEARDPLGQSAWPVSLEGGLPSPIEDSPFDQTAPPFAEDRTEAATGDDEPMLSSHEESPFEEPVAAQSVAAFEVEQPAGMQILSAPEDDAITALLLDDANRVEGFEEEPELFGASPVEAPEPATGSTEEVAETTTMADLYARQGLVNDARHIYENMLARDPENAEVRARLDAIAPRVNPRIERLERWLARVARKEVGRV